jgi:hypothetical protein
MAHLRTGHAHRLGADDLEAVVTAPLVEAALVLYALAVQDGVTPCKEVDGEVEGFLKVAIGNFIPDLVGYVVHHLACFRVKNRTFNEKRLFFEKMAIIALSGVDKG